MVQTRTGLPLQAMRDRALGALDELASGGLAERMRRDAAAHVLVIARRVGALVRAGEIAVPHAENAANDAASIVTRLAADWDPFATTAAEFVEALSPAELDQVISAAPAWAALLASAQGVAEPRRRAA